MLSDALHQFGESWTERDLDLLAYGCLSPDHAGQFKAFIKQVRGKYQLAAIIKGDVKWPREPDDRDVLYFLAHSFRAQLIKELPPERDRANGAQREFAHRAKSMLGELANISLEIAQLVVAGSDERGTLPNWFMVEVVRDLPRLATTKEKKS
jgi:hypothetical protein